MATAVSVRAHADLGALTPSDIQSQFFEFFPAGTHVEVLFLGAPVWDYFHWCYPTGTTRKNGRTYLCGFRTGKCRRCDLLDCDLPGAETIEPRKIEYCAPTYVRKWKEKIFRQKIATLTEAGYRQLSTLIPADGFRAQRIEVARFKQGTSTRYKFKSLVNVPGDFRINIPAAFDVNAFLRARFGKTMLAGMQLVELPPIQSEELVRETVRAEAAAFSADDHADPDELAKMRALLRGAEGPAPSGEPTVAAIDVEAEQEATEERDPATEQAAKLATGVTGAEHPAEYKPKRTVVASGTIKLDPVTSPGAALLGDVLRNTPAGKRLREAANGKKPQDKKGGNAA